uniref:Uncharacterized protein n=1 Tax=Chlorobium phaeobacteroides (strain BS1) TaxID=331678 RepID=B3EPL8_CHLPB
MEIRKEMYDLPASTARRSIDLPAYPYYFRYIVLWVGISLENICLILIIFVMW